MCSVEGHNEYTNVNYVDRWINQLCMGMKEDIQIRFWTYLIAHFYNDIVSYEYPTFKSLEYIPRHDLWLNNKWWYVQCKQKHHVIFFTKVRQTKLKEKLLPHQLTLV